jgi:hypothetical protein
MKLVKRKNILLTSMLLGSVALSTVGFAAWVIVGGASEEQSGDISVDTVIDKSHDIVDFAWGASITENKAEDDSRIVFGGKPATNKPEKLEYNNWLGYEESTEKVDVPNENGGTEKIELSLKEDLSASFSFTVTKIETSVKDNTETTDKNEKADAMVEVAKGLVSIGALTSGDAYAAALNAKYVGALPTPSFVSATANVEKGTVTMNYKITFTWGDYFKVTYKDSKTANVNPIDFYNSKGRDDKVSNEQNAKTWAEDADAVLNGDVFQALKDETYKMTIVVAASSAA